MKPSGPWTVTGITSAPALLFAALVSLGAACDRDRETATELLRERQLEWSADLATLRRDCDRLQRDLASLPKPADDGIPTVRLRTQAGLASVRQTLADVENRATQSGPRLQSALRGNGDAALKAVENETTRMNGYLASLHEGLGRLHGEIDDLRPKSPSHPSPITENN